LLRFVPNAIGVGASLQFIILNLFNTSMAYLLLVSNFAFDLVRNPIHKPLLPALHYLFPFDLNHCFHLVMVCVLAFWIISLSLEF
jgi:hypothetical protein